MVKSKDELLETIRTRLGDATDDDSLALLEDVTDTLTDYETKTADQTDWKAKYEENDASWRNRYHDRFFNNEEDAPDDDSFTDNIPLKFDDLFKQD